MAVWRRLKRDEGNLVPFNDLLLTAGDCLVAADEHQMAGDECQVRVEECLRSVCWSSGVL